MRNTRSGSMASAVIEQQADGGAQLAPGVGLLRQSPPALRRQLVVLRAPVVVRHVPLGLDPAFAFEPMERRIQRPLVDAQRVPGNLLDALRDRPSVLRLER